jgi:hypothetical protein
MGDQGDAESDATFAIEDEDHTLANAVRFMLNKKLVSLYHLECTLLNLTLLLFFQCYKVHSGCCSAVSRRDEAPHG